MHSRNWSSRQMLHLPERETYDACVHFQMLPHATHEAPIGQQPVCRRTLYGCAPQHTPGVVCEKATLQSFLKQQLSQPTEASCRGACDSGAAVSRDSVLASTMVTMLIAIFLGALQTLQKWTGMLTFTDICPRHTSESRYQWSEQF